MKTEIITKEKPKEFEPFELRITVESIEDLEDVIKGTGAMLYKNTGDIHDDLKALLNSRK